MEKDKGLAKLTCAGPMRDPLGFYEPLEVPAAEEDFLSHLEMRKLAVFCEPVHGSPAEA